MSLGKALENNANQLRSEKAYQKKKKKNENNYKFSPQKEDDLVVTICLLMKERNYLTILKKFIVYSSKRKTKTSR